MRTLFFKIFIIFWIAQSLIFVISTTVIIKSRSPRPDFFLNAVFDGMRSASAEAASVYESGGCDALSRMRRPPDNIVVLEDESGKELCGDSRLSSLPANAGSSEISGRQVGDRYVWSAPVTAKSGRGYRYVLSVPRHGRQHPWYEDLLHFAFPQLPVAIAVGGLTTFVLVLIFTRPLIRLRKAARELASGNLHARVKETGGKSGVAPGDEFHGLVHDFNHMAERLQSLVDAHKLLLRDVSHELRSPLARLSVALELGREDADATMVHHLDRMERETERLNQLIGQLLTLSSMEAVESVERSEPVSLRQVLEEMLPDAQYEARQRDTSVVLHAECDGVIEGRRELLYRAVENVLRNAVRYTDAGSAVEVKLYESKAGADRMAIVEVSDRGPGIPDAERESILRPFYRLDQARSEHTGGFGVGLAIADRAVKLHKGQLEILNRDEGGAIIRMRFRMADSANLPGSDAEASRMQSSQT